MRDYCAEIESWRNRKDEEEYLAAKKAEDETWAAQRELASIYPKIKEINKIATKCKENKLDISTFTTAGNHKVFFMSIGLDEGMTLTYRSMSCVCTYDYIFSENGLVYSGLWDNTTSDKNEKKRIYNAENLKYVRECALEFISRFYSYLDEILKS